MGVYNPDNTNYFDVTTDQSPTTGFHEDGSTPTPGSVSGATGSSGGGGSNWWDGISQFLPGGVQGVNGNVSLSMLIPAMAQAYQQYKNSGTYRDLGREAAGMANPFGQYRQQYGDELSALYKDPSQIENTPGYKFTMNQTLDQTQKRLAGMGYGGSSEMQTGLADQAAGLASKTWDTERNALMQLAGAQFNPAYAAQMMMEGGKLSVDSQNAALAALFSPFGNRAGANTNALGAGGTGIPGVSSQLASQLARTYGTNAASLGAGAVQLARQFPGMFLNNGQLAGWAQLPDGSINWDRVAEQFNLNNQPMPYTDGTIQQPLEPFNPQPNDFTGGNSPDYNTDYLGGGGPTGADVVTTPYIDTPAPDAMPDFESSDYSWMFGG